MPQSYDSNCVLDQYAEIIRKDTQVGFDLLVWAVDLVLPKADFMGDNRHTNGLKAYHDFKESKISIEALKAITGNTHNTIECLCAYRDAFEDVCDFYKNDLPYSYNLPFSYVIDIIITSVEACHNLLKSLICYEENQNWDEFLIDGMRDALDLPLTFFYIEKKIQNKYNEMCETHA